MKDGFFESMIRSVAAALLLATAVPALHAQIGGGSIVGTVKDPTGAVVVGVAVTATHIGTNEKREATTKDDGYYEFPLLAAGSYRLEAVAQGFQRATTAIFDLNAGTRPRFDLVLVLGQIAEQVQVLGAAPLVNTTTTDLGVVVSQTRLEGIPLNGRNWQQVVGLQAGALASPNSEIGKRGGLEFNGASAFSNNLLLDGVDMTFGENQAAANDQAGGAGVNGAKINTVSVEAIQEFKTTGGAFSAEYGRATGGVINVTTKSGSNDFHGTLFEFFRNDALDANDFFSNKDGLKKPPLRWNQYGANLGGPIKRNRAFFFANYEGAVIRRNSQITGNVASAALRARITNPLLLQTLNYQPLPTESTSNPDVGFHRRNDVLKNDENTLVTRGDVNLGSHRLTTRYSYNHQDTSLPVITPANPTGFPTRFHNGVFQDNWTVSPTIFNELRLGINHVNLDRLNAGIEDATNTVLVPGSLSVDGVGLGVSWLAHIHYITSTYTVADNFTMLKGRHTVKIGFEIREIRSKRYQNSPVGHTYRNIPDLVADLPYRYSVTFGGDKKLSNGNRGVFVQDDWRVSKRLQLNIGLRYEYTPPLKGAFNIVGSDPFGPFGKNTDPMWDPDRNNFGPRVGIVWDVMGNQKFVMRAGGGISYMPSTYMYFFDMSYLDPRIPANSALERAEVPAGISLSFPLGALPFIDAVKKNPNLLPQSQPLTRNIINHANDDEYAGMWNLSLQYAVKSNLAVQASYVGTRSVNNWGTRWLNLATFVPSASARVRAAPTIGDIRFSENDGRSSYHALQLQANQKFNRGLGIDFYYTFAKALSYYVVDTTTNSATALQDHFNIAGSYGPKGSDIRHNATIVYSYALPTGPMRSGFASALLKGWEIQGLSNWRSGLPVNGKAGVDFVQNGRPGDTRPDYVGGVDPYIRNTDTLVWLNKAAFDIVTPRLQNRFGNLGYNALRGPSAFSLDMALHKTFNIREGHRVTFRFEMFNAFNHTLLGDPNPTASDVRFGTIQTLAGPPRSIQFGLKYFF